MRRFIPLLSLLTISLSLLACKSMPDVVFGIPLVSPTPGPVPNNTVDVRTLTEIPATSIPTETATPAMVVSPVESVPPQAIAFLSPATGSQVTSPITVSGVANSVFENMLAIQVVDQSGQVIGNGVASIHADLGGRGPFDGQVSFTPPAEAQPGRIVVSDSSARDGHLTYLTSMEVTLLPNGGTANLTTDTEHAETFWIQSVTPGVSNGHHALSIIGYAAPAFEQTLTIAVLDENGGLVGSGTATIQAGAGQPGQFIGSVTYDVDHEEPGSVQAYATSARDGGLIHLNSLNVTLQP